MRVLETIRKNPVAALCVVIAGVLGWAAAGIWGPDAPQAFRPPPSSPPAATFSAAVPAVESSEQPPECPTVTRSVPVALLPRLKPGMTRVEVERVIGPPDSDSLHPALVTDNGRLTYRTAYTIAEPDEVATVRPIGRPPRVLPRPTDLKSQVALEFDASKPGHPLIEILYLDPLF